MREPLKVDEEARCDRYGGIRLRVMAPTGASSVRLVGIAQGGRAGFDECALRRLRSRERRLRVFVNQVGYDTAGPKTAIVASNFFPPDRTTLAFQLLGRDGQVAWAQDLSCSGRIYGGTKDDWGWYFWRADFSRCRMAGDFHAAAHSGKVACESAPFRIASGVLLEETARSAVDFFFVQRCGFDVPGSHKPCHLDDAKLPDGSHLDATGGWHSAGDYNKLMYEHGDGGVAFALLKAFQSAPAVFGRFDRNSDGMPDALDEALWGRCCCRSSITITL